MTPDLAPVSVTLRVARSQLYVRELPENRGPAVEQYQAVGFNDPGASWCMDYALWCLLVGLGAVPVKRSGRVQDVVDDAKARGFFHEDGPVVGDIFVEWFPALGRYAHAGFVETVPHPGWTTLEGNSNAGGSREGIGVFARTRGEPADLARYGYIRWMEALAL